MDQKDYCNNASNKQFTTPFQNEKFMKYVQKTAKIIDVGCGYGRTLKRLYDLGYKNLIGIDFSEKMIEKGKNLYPYLDLQVKRTNYIDFEDNSADAVILFGVLTCIVNNTEQIALLEEIHRILKPNGILYINDFLLNTDERNIERYNQFKDKYQYGIFELPEGAILRHHDINWINKSLEHFEKLELEKTVFETMNGHKSNGFYYFGRKKV